jgi:S-adenosylmethionine:tRNA ribosyltransferase-isomerase
MNPASSAKPHPNLPLSLNTFVNPPRPWQVEDFDFELPQELIAQHPVHPRSASKLLDGTDVGMVDRHFYDLPQLLQKGDLLIFNDTKVLKARLFGEKSTGGQVELLIERVLPPPSHPSEAPHQVAVHMRVSKKPRLGGVIHLNGGHQATLLSRWPNEDGPLFRMALSSDPYLIMEENGHLPLPPYIEHTDTEEDAENYQTIFAKHLGAVAAPTAALHFEESTLLALEAMGVERAAVTLHVGAGTFQPVKAQNIHEHHMHSEHYIIPPKTQEALLACKQRGSRVVAVGTTCVRTLESWAASGLSQGDTNIFITPGFEFKWVDLMLTNFHLPKSTLMMLVSAFCGYEHTRRLYAHAIAKQYRFFSYGDAMLLKRQPLESSHA